MGLQREYELAATEGFLSRPADAGEPLTPEDTAGLPDCVKRYLGFTGAIGRPKVWNYRLRFTGRLRNAADAPWMNVHIDQQSFVEPAARLFLIRASMFGVPFVTLHRLVGDSATFRVRLLGLFTVVDAAGKEMDQSETVTLLNDMALLAPSSLASPRLSWSEVDALQARATFSNAGHTVSALLCFDETGALVDFVSHDRFRTSDGKSYTLAPWSTPVDAWADFDGRRLPVKARARWLEPEGELCYASFEIGDVAYNVPG